ncbi:MAG TPA: polysaccharide biosynthesis tyrosine autokinase [Chloroflexi bacterium]|nr:polysaccharide biosynthesis tyrosine autokinase [Chloroflexota bacterium]
MELRQYIAVFKRWWWLVALLLVLGAAGGYLSTRQKNTVYAATTTLLISPGRSQLPDANAVTSGQRVAETYATLILQPYVMERTIENLGLDMSPNSLARRTKAINIVDTNLLEVTVEDSDPQRAALLANEIARVFIEENQLRQAARFNSSREDLEEEIANAQQEISDLRTQVEQIQANVNSLEAQLARNQDEIESALTRLDEIPTELALKQARLNAINDLPAYNLTGDILIEQALLEQEIKELEFEQQRLEEQLPERTALQTELENQIEELLAQKNPLEVQLDQAEARYSALLQSYEDLRLTDAQAADYVIVVQEATEGKPVNQINPTVRTIQGLIVGGVLAVGLVLFIEYLNNAVRSAEEAEKLTGIPALGAIGRIPVGEKQDILVTVRKPRSPNAEAYRVLRTNLEFASANNPIHSIVVTSSSADEGKTTTAANLAIAMAQAGRRVILVDGDLRRPSLHRIFEQENEAGVTTALQMGNGGSLREHMVSTGVENLLLMTSGPLPLNPADLLQSQRMDALIRKLETLADLVIFDSPPILDTADAAILAHGCDAALLVVHAGSTPASALKQASERIRQSGTAMVWLVLNRVRDLTQSFYEDQYVVASAAE